MPVFAAADRAEAADETPGGVGTIIYFEKIRDFL